MTRRVLLDRDLMLTWLDASLGLVARGAGAAETRTALRDRVRHDGLGEAATAKTVTVLMRTWVSPPQEAAATVDWAVQRSSHVIDSRPLHIGAMLATQPFFMDQAAVVGRILAVQDDVETPVVRQRMKAIWGPRRSVDIATQRTMKTMRSLGMLLGEPSSSTSNPAPAIPVDTAVAGWLAACLMIARRSDSLSLSELAAAPELAWFEWPASVDLEAAGLSRYTEGAGRTVLVRGK